MTAAFPNLPLVSLLSAATAVAVLSVLLAYMDLAAESWANPLDRRVSRLLVLHRTKDETKAMHLFSQLGGPIGIPLAALLGTAGFLRQGQTQAAELFILTLGAAAAYVLLMKLITARKRPSLRVLEHERTFSFPSAHSLLSTFVYGSLVMFFYTGLSPVPFILVALLLLAIGTSRIYLGCHYLSDVIAGILAGGVWTGIFIYLSRA